MQYLGKIVDAKDLTTKVYVDTGLNTKINKGGQAQLNKLEISALDTAVIIDANGKGQNIPLIDFLGHVLENLGDPVVSTDAVNKKYADTKTRIIVQSAQPTGLSVGDIWYKIV